MISKNEHNQPTVIRYILLAFISVFVFFILISQYLMTQERRYRNTVYPNIYLDGKHIGGLTKSEIAGLYDKKNEALKQFDLTVVYKDETVATFSAEKINLRSNAPDITERAFLIGRSSHASSRYYQKLTALLGFTSHHFTSSIVYDDESVKELITTLEEQYNKPARNALFTFEEGRVVSFREDEKGVKINVEKFRNDVAQVIKTLDQKVADKTITLSDSLIEPEVTLKNSNDFGIEEVIGEGVSDYSHSIPERIHNLQLAASKFHGILIPKDKEFSFNDAVGDISSLTGYKPAYIIKNGRTVLGDGGGVCQVSTTLFRAAMNAGLPIVERTAHAYRVIYYENDAKPGLDATVFSPSVDLKFKNNTPAAILMLTEVDADYNILKIRFYGKKDGRSVELSDVTILDEQPPPPAVYQDDPTLKKGVVKQVDWPAWGARTFFTYKVTKGDETIFERKFNSNFRPWQAVYLVGTAD